MSSDDSGAKNHPDRIKGGSTEDTVYLLVKTRTIFECVLHWILVGSVITLALTGLYISNPPTVAFDPVEPYQRYTMGYARLAHFTAAPLAIVTLLIRYYIAIISPARREALQFLPTIYNIVTANKMIFKYLTLTESKESYRFVNPLGGIGVFSITAAIVVMAMTGVLLYLPGAAGGVGMTHSETIFGSQQTVRLIHHLTMYILVFFILVHVYMQFWKNSMYKDSDMSSIIGGYKLFPVEEIANFQDRYGAKLNEPAPTEGVMRENSSRMEEGPGNH